MDPPSPLYLAVTVLEHAEAASARAAARWLHGSTGHFIALKLIHKLDGALKDQGWRELLNLKSYLQSIEDILPQ